MSNLLLNKIQKVINFSEKDLETRLFNLKQQRNIFYSFRCYPRPKSSPYDEEIKEIEKILKKEVIE